MQTARMVSSVLALGLLTAACGDARSSLSPTAPSAVSPDSLNVEAGTPDRESGTMGNGPKPGNGNGNGNGNGRGNGNQPRTPDGTTTSPTPPVPPGKNKVEFEGVLQSVGGGSVTVNGQVIAVTGNTTIRHGNRHFELSELNVGDRVHVRAMRVASTPPVATSALAETTLEASLILLQNPGDAVDPGESEDDGLVSVTAFDASAIEGVDNNGVFRLTRAGTAAHLGVPLTVTYALSGTAVNGTDFTSVPLTATFGAGQPSVDIVIAPLADGSDEGGETVILTLTGVSPYELGSPISATVHITDAANPLVGASAIDPSAHESGDTGRIVLMRTGDLASPLTVTVTLTGSAINGTDYETLATTVTFAAGAASVNVFVIPVGDATADPTETVILTVVDGAGYDLAAMSTGTVTISGT